MLWQVNRSTIVNLNEMRSVARGSAGKLMISPKEPEKALIERAMTADLSHHPGNAPDADKPETATNHPQWGS